MRKQYLMMIAAGLVALMCGCSNAQKTQVAESTTEVAAVIETEAGTKANERMMEITPDGPLLPSLEQVEAEYTEPAPDYLRLGLQHPIVAQLQAQLMKLGFMDNDEPSDYFGEVTQAAVKTYQRQNNLTQDGIIGPDTYNAIMAADAKYYAAKNGDDGDDISRIQNRLYELGYLSSADMVTSHFGDSTEEAVKKMQSVNGIEQDGTVGMKTMNLLYSDDVKPNMLTYGEQSELVLAAQKRLKLLGYMTSEPDGNYGNDTVIAVKQFQARNDQVVDGYLGPSTRMVLNSDTAVSNGLVLGDQGDSVQRVQQLLAKLGYLNSANTTGYFGDVTEQAVKLFQSTNGLSSDGSVGAITMASLTSTSAKKAPAKKATTTTKASSSKTGSSSSSGSSSSTSAPNTGSAAAGSSASALIAVASSKLGSPYVWGSKGPSSFDCSGFVYWCLNQVGVRQSYMTSSGWRNPGRYTRISNFSSLQAGDIVVVSGHVGIVAGGGTVIDASSSSGRVVHRSLSGWWANNFIVGWRIF